MTDLSGLTGASESANFPRAVDKTKAKKWSLTRSDEWFKKPPPPGDSKILNNGNETIVNKATQQLNDEGLEWEHKECWINSERMEQMCVQA